MQQIRDLSVVDLPAGQVLLTACDISASIGDKEHDVLHVEPALTGKMTVRTALLEILATGAEVVAVTNMIGAEMHPTGEKIIAGIREELESAGLGHIILNGSTEDNMKTSQTSVSVVVNGIGEKAALKMNSIRKDAAIFGFGKPKVGEELLREPELEVNFKLIRQLAQHEHVMETVPVGSKGILTEAEKLAEVNNCIYRSTPACPEEWLRHSAGPSTAAIVAVDRAFAASFEAEFPQAYLVGYADRKK